MIEQWAVYLVVGAIAGIAAGLLGIGGGFIIVPALYTLLSQAGIPEDKLMHVAVGTSLATICVTSLSSLRAHHKRNAVDWFYVKLLAPGIVVGALAAGVIADQFSSRVLAVVFAIGAMVMAGQIGFSRQPKQAPTRPSAVSISLTAGSIGCASALVGIGGGSLVVPYLHYLGERITRCVGTAAACGLPIAIAGTASYVIMGWDVELPRFTLGYIYLPAFLGIIVASSLAAPLGARLAHSIPAKKLKRVFAVFLLLVGLGIIVKHLG